MNMGLTVTGVDQILKNLQAELNKSKRVFRSGLIAGGLMLEAQCTRKITEVLYSIPEDDDKERKRTGNLRASRFTMWTGRTQVQVPTFDVVEGEEPVLPGFEQALADSQGIVDSASAGDRTAVLLGYGAYYSLYVHEGVNGKFEGFKWIELALAEVQDDLLQVITHGGSETP